MQVQLVGLAAQGSWSEQITAAAEQFMNAAIEIYDPNTSVPPTIPYDPVTGLGGESEPAVLWSGKARVQHLRQPQEVTTAAEWTAYRSYRFQVPLDEVSGLIDKGMRIRVTDAGRDPSLLQMTYTIEASTNSSHAAVRTFETTAENVGN